MAGRETDDECPSQATAVAKEALALSEHMNERNNALRLYVSDLTAVILRMVAGIDHLSEIARQWEPDHSSGADRRGWVLAKNARDDALRLLQEHQHLKAESMSALDDIGKAIKLALEECPTADVLSVITGTFVGLTVELCRRNGHDAAKQITIDGGANRDITIHAKKGG